MRRIPRNVIAVSTPTLEQDSNTVKRMEAMRAIEKWDAPGDNERMNTSAGIAYFMESEINRTGHKGPRQDVDPDAIGGWTCVVKHYESQYD